MTTPAGEGKAPPAAAILLEIMRRDYWVSRTEQGMPFAVRQDTPSVMIPLKGNGGLHHQGAQLSKVCQLSQRHYVKPSRVPQG